MTTYTAIADADIDPESPGTTTLFNRLRDNPIAITEGSAGAPEIQPAALADTVGDSLVWLSSQSASADATIDFTTEIDGTYDSYIVRLVNVLPVASSATLQMRLAVSGTFQAGATDYREVSSNVGSLSMAASVDGTASIGGFSGIVRVADPNSAIHFCNVDCRGGYRTAAGVVTALSYNGQATFASAIDGFRFFMSTGNISEGQFHLYGVKTS